MEMFSKAELLAIKEKAARHPEVIAALDKETADLRRKLYIQKTGRATWSHYYVCPDCGVRLLFNYDDPLHYECPACHNILTGEPYEGSWWDTVMVKNSGGSFQLATLYTVTGDEKYLKPAKDILLGYAENYKNFEVHGNIPYNKPGRFACQVLSDAGPLAELARAYALLKDSFTAEEQQKIENDLFCEACKHQMKYSTDQLHNHEVVICSSLAIMALVIGDSDVLHFAVDRKYGLKYQLDHSVLSDGMWFEVAMGYHSFSLRWLMRYELMARGTEHSLLADHHYREILDRMIRFPLNLVTPTGYPFFNDADTYFAPDVYEYYYANCGDGDILKLLHECYRTENRNANIYALLYGVAELPEAAPYEYADYLPTAGSQIAVVNGERSALWFKAAPYGGEHDHYDRLSLSMSAYGVPACVDLGTAAGYGSPMHYAYYKNTANHNTVVIDGENMPPCDTRVLKYERRAADDVYLEAQTEIPEKYDLAALDSFTIKQWCDEAYAGVRYRRAISWHDGYIIDVFRVTSDNDLRKEWCWHAAGKYSLPEGAVLRGRFSESGPQSYMHDTYSVEGKGTMRFDVDCGKVKLRVHSDAEGKEMLLCYGPNNPSTSDVAYLVERSFEKCPVYVNVIELYRDEPTVRDVQIERDGDTVTVKVAHADGSERVRTFEL